MQPATAEDEIDWPEHVGVGGVSVRAARSEPQDLSPALALTAVRGWMYTIDGTSPPAARFPFAELLAHYRAVGRANVDDAVTTRLRRIYFLLCGLRPAERRRWWPLPAWLPSAIDQRTGDYGSYLVAGLLDDPTAAPEFGSDEVLDDLIAGLAADLVRLEAEALGLGVDTREQRQRVRAGLLVLTRLGKPAVAAVSADSREVDDPRLAEAAAERAHCVAATLPRQFHTIADLALLPTTRLHDEQMFIRSLQIFETLFQLVARRLDRATEALRWPDTGRACAELADATARLHLAAPLFRVVTTMPQDTFAIIRNYTTGRSAIQSRWYRRVEFRCAHREVGVVADKIPITKTAPTLQDAFLAARDRLEPAERNRLTAEMGALDAVWRAMKRTHWGITLKIIGSVPGTGGTAGADYLKEAAKVPLFPMLAP